MLTDRLKEFDVLSEGEFEADKLGEFDTETLVLSDVLTDSDVDMLCHVPATRG